MPPSDELRPGELPLSMQGSTLDAPPRKQGVPPGIGRVMGGRYEIRGVLGRGGMGEVWLARDLRLQVEVALKALLSERLDDAGSVARLRAEVRSARTVSSPHVCRVYDLVEAEGLELVSMEYVDGTTLRHVLATRSPLELPEARDIALQLLAGLGAIHEAGLVHRDVKPENVMLTRAGRVVLMDFGIAKAVASGGTVAGTPAYWPPEQAAGTAADPRADVFAAGIVLAEMVAPGGTREPEARRAVWRAMREDPAKVPDTPWSEAIRRAVSSEPRNRFPSAQALARALEDVAHRVLGIEEAQPYPGLASFTEAEAAYFFGREAEVEGVWKRLPQRHLLAVVGSSGAGKSSFLRAGLVPAKPEGWAHLVCTPGDAPFVALGQALVPEVSRDTAAMRQMLRFEDANVAVDLFRRWRGDHAEALVVVDQFEELFTLNPPEVQARFATLLSRLTLEADVHVLLAMRDDFLLRCQEHEALRPIFSDLVPLGPPAGDALRRALVQPALKCGYRFEDEALVSDMLHAVEGERGALPLLAFAAASLWERRDREQGLLTRAAHDAIGGVAGALAQHAETTLDRLGAEKLPLVRELFRNLVTAEGTRAVRDVDELLTVFLPGQRARAETALKALVDARLLTSYEAHATEPGQTAGRRAEVVHESLLSAWPRLVRWRTEDEGGAQIRDQLRQAAHLWEEKGRPEDLLWTGTVYREFELWRERYPGGLSEAEESFGRAMVARAGRRRRMRRLGVASVILVLAGVLTVVGTSLRRTRAALTRTDASRLVALGRAVGVENDPTSTLAYAIASLERADSSEARTLALEAMAHGPVAIILSGDTDANAKFSGDGRWLATGPIDPSTPGPDTQVWARDGTRTRFPFARPEAIPYQFATGADALFLVDRQGDGGRDLVFAAYSLPDGRRLAGTTFRPPAAWRVLHDPARFAVLQLRGGRADLRVFPVDPPGDPVDTSYDLRGFVEDWPTYADLNDEKRTRRRAQLTFDPRGRWLAVPVGRDVILQPLRPHEPARRLAHHDAEVMALASSPDGKVLAARDTGGSIRLWSVASGAQVAALDADASSSHLEFSEDGRTVLARGGRRETGNGVTAGSLLVWRQPFTSAAPDREIRHPEGFFRIATDRSARWIAVGTTSRHAELWDLAAPADALPLALRRGVDRATPFVSLHPDGTWIAVCDISEMTLRPLGGQLPRVLSGHKAGVNAMAFAPDGQYVVSLGKDFEMRLWPLTGDPPAASRLLLSQKDGLSFLQDLATVPDGSFWAVSSSSGQLALVRPEGGTRTMRAFSGEIYGVATSPDGRRVAVGGTVAEEARVKVLEVASGREIAVLDAGDRVPIISLAFLPDGTLATGSSAGVRVWDVDGGTYRSLWAPSASDRQATVQWIRSCATDRVVFAYGTGAGGTAYVADVTSGSVRRLETHGDLVFSVAIDRTGSIVATGSQDGIVRVGPASGESPHLLIGHTSMVRSLAISPAGDRIASGGDDTTVRLWPMPDLTKPPAQTLPLPQLLAKLKSQTNLRVVADAGAPGGYRLEAGPFPGWAVVPEWQP